MRKGCVRRFAAVWLLPSLMMLTGCGGKGDVSGKVTFDGKPVPAGRVTFLSEVGNKSSFVGTIKDGVYTIVDCPAGPVKISVETFPPRAAANPNTAPAGVPQGAMAGFKPPENADSFASPPGQYVQLPPKLADPINSGLTYTVTSGKQDHPLALTK